jgi:hypothetical protein
MLEAHDRITISGPGWRRNCERRALCQKRCRLTRNACRAWLARAQSEVDPRRVARKGTLGGTQCDDAMITQDILRKMSAYRSRLVATAEEDSLNLHTRVERPGRKATLIGYADPRRGACSTRLAISSQICAMASRSARSFSAETVSRVSRHFFARCRYSSGPFFGCVGGFKRISNLCVRRQCNMATTAMRYSPLCSPESRKYDTASRAALG